nr:hypothetical protein [Tanacetum cinerariifolium]
MATTIEQQVALDEALVPSTQMLRIRRSNFRLPLDIQSKESTLQLLYDVLCRHQNTQQYGAMLPIKLKNDEIGNSKAYKEYYALATGEVVPKAKASARRKRSGSDTSITPPTATTTPTRTVDVTPRQLLLQKANNQPKPKVHLTPQSTNEGTGSKPRVPDVPTDESEEKLSWNSSDDEGNDAQEKVSDDDEGNEGKDSEEGEEDDDDDDDEDKNGEERDDDDDDQDQEVAKHDDKDDSEESKEVDEEGDGEEDQGVRISEEERLNEEEEAEELYRDGRGIQATLDVTLTLVHPDGQQESSSVSSHFVTSMLNPPSDADRLKSLEANFSKYIQTNPFAKAVSNIPGIVHQYMNQQMTEAVRVAVQRQTNWLHDSYQRENDEFIRTIDKNMKRIIKEQSVNAQLEAEVLTRSSHSSRTSYAVAADLSETELKKILIENMEGNKSIQRSDEQRNLYKALVDAYEADKTILDSYGETVILKRRRDDDDDQDEGPSAGSDRGSKRRREGADDQTIVQSSQHPEWFSQPKKPPTPNCDWNKTLPAGVSHWGRKRHQFYGFAVNWESALDVYSKRRIIVVTDLKIVEWHSYKHLNWITVRHDNDKLYKFKEADFKRLRLQDIEDMMLLLVQGKLSNLTVEERFAFNVSLRMFTRSIVIQRRVENLQLGVKSYQKRLNLTKPDTYRSNLKRKEAYTAYSNPRGFIYQKKDKKNRLMRIDELYKFSDGTLNDVRNALDDRLKGIRMQYLPQTIWRKGDKDRAAAMIQAIDKMLKTRRIMRSLERFVGGRLFEGDFWMLQRSI